MDADLISYESQLLTNNGYSSTYRLRTRIVCPGSDPDAVALQSPIPYHANINERSGVTGQRVTAWYDISVPDFAAAWGLQSPVESGALKFCSSNVAAPRLT